MKSLKYFVLEQLNFWFTYHNKIIGLQITIKLLVYNNVYLIFIL